MNTTRNYFQFLFLVFMVRNQSGGAPFIDKACMYQDERRYEGIAILLKPWRRNKYGESMPQKCLMIFAKGMR